MRKIIKIDEDKCDGCGLCASACHEGAIIISNGKARLAGEIYCDGLGDCLGECPRGAISIETREAAPYDEAAVRARNHEAPREPGIAGEGAFCGCPGAAAKELITASTSGKAGEALSGGERRSELRNWPVQIKLVPAEAPYLKSAELLIAADCTAFACPDFHDSFLRSRVCLVGCPKLDGTEFYAEKLAQIIRLNKVASIDVVYMEVPCCGGLAKLAEKAVVSSGEPVTLNLSVLSLEGRVLETRILHG